jgi:hypothetical protein
MIDRQGNRIIWECDSCPELFESDEDEEFSGGALGGDSAGPRTLH